MKSLVKSLVLFGVCAIMSISLTSCSSEEVMTQNTKEDSIQNGITNSNIQKEWVLAHFEFTENCDKATRQKYQLSMINLKFKGNRYEAFDSYHLEEDLGIWTLENNILTLISGTKESTLVLKIDDFNKLEMHAEVIGNPSISGILFISK